jgi:hypothetical protein
LIDKYVAGAKDRFAIKAYIILVKVRGQIQNSSGKFCFFYDDELNPKQAVPAIQWKSATLMKFLT